MNKKLFAGIFLILLGSVIAYSTLNLYPCSVFSISPNICQTIKAKIGLVAFVAIVLGGFLSYNSAYGHNKNGMMHEIGYFFRSTGIYIPEEKKAQSIIFGAGVALIYYHLLFGNLAGGPAPLYEIFLKEFTAIILAPLVEEIVYRGILILGLYNFSSYLINEYMDLNEENFPSFFKGFLIFLLIFSSVSFASDHTNPKTVVLGLIYGILFLSQRNILMPLAAHTTHNLTAFVYEYVI